MTICLNFWLFKTITDLNPKTDKLNFATPIKFIIKGYNLIINGVKMVQSHNKCKYKRADKK